MEDNNKKKRMSFMDIMHEIKEFILEHSKLFMPIILVIGVLLTVFFAINANQREKLEQEALKVAVAAEVTNTEGQGADVIETPEFGVEEDTPQFSYEYDSCGSGSASYMFTMKLNETDLMMYDSMYAKGGFSADTNSEEITDNYMASTVYGDEVYFTFETKYLAPKFDNDITSSANRNLILILGGIIDGEVYETKKVINTN